MLKYLGLRLFLFISIFATVTALAKPAHVGPQMRISLKGATVDGVPVDLTDPDIPDWALTGTIDASDGVGEPTLLLFDALDETYILTRIEP